MASKRQAISPGAARVMPPPMAIAPAFTPREVELIIRSLPEGLDQRRLKLLPKILREWARNDLPMNLSAIPAKTRLARIKRLGKVSDCARKLLQALDAAKRNDEWFLIIAEMIRGLGTDLPERLAERTKFQTQFYEMRSFLGKLSAAAAASEKIWEQGRGHPSNIIARRVLMDIIAIYEWLTGEKATRSVDAFTSKNTSPFWWFAVTIWPLIFGSEKSLSATLKNWRDAVKQKRTGIRSPLIINIAMRHPTWGIRPWPPNILH